MKRTYIIEIKVNGEWKVWARYETADAEQRAEMGMKVARCYGECRLVER